MSRPLRGATTLPVGVLLLAGCTAGPADVESGQYRAFAASPTVGTPPPAFFTVVGTDVTVTINGEARSRTASPGVEEFVLCPPDGTGAPLPVGEPLAIGLVTFLRPAVFGDCGQTTPKRITLVDLASADDQNGPFPFTRWIEFCNTTSAGCP